MSTTAGIIVKVRKEDIGRFRKCDPTKLRLRTKKDLKARYDIIYPGNKYKKERKERIDWSLKFEPLPTVKGMLEATKRVKLPEYLEIYVNWDGYPSGVGNELKTNYGTYDLALNLALAGDFSTIVEGSVPYACSKRFNVAPKLSNALWWKNCMPKKSKSITERSTDYQYYFDGDKWWYKDKEEEFKEL